MIGRRGLTGARFTMNALLLHQDDNYTPTPVDPTDYGQWVRSQDPLTGDIVRIWQPYDDDNDPNTPTNPSWEFNTIPCLVRGIVDGGIRVAGTTERFGDMYENIDYAKMWLPPYIRITKRDRITNIRDINGHVRWRDEEFEPRDPNNPLSEDDPTTYQATVFNVNGVTPLFNAFNRVVEQFVLLQRATVYEDTSAG